MMNHSTVPAPWLGSLVSHEPPAATTGRKGLMGTRAGTRKRWFFDTGEKAMLDLHRLSHVALIPDAVRQLEEKEAGG